MGEGFQEQPAQQPPHQASMARKDGTGIDEGDDIVDAAQGDCSLHMALLKCL
jgi:hypothetical protein